MPGLFACCGLLLLEDDSIVNRALAIRAGKMLRCHLAILIRQRQLCRLQLCSSATVALALRGVRRRTGADDDPSAYTSVEPTRQA